jgi:hypothetical protein
VGNGASASVELTRMLPGFGALKIPTWLRVDFVKKGSAASTSPISFLLFGSFGEGPSFFFGLVGKD